MHNVKRWNVERNATMYKTKLVRFDYEK